MKKLKVDILGYEIVGMQCSYFTDLYLPLLGGSDEC
jgi:hypothetical protein